jgi:hypothetical protein
MEVEPGFAAKCTVAINNLPTQCVIQESAIVAEAQNVDPGETTVRLLMPEHRSPAELRGVPDHRKLGLALAASDP